jgi:hypothetical protein
MHVPLEEHGWFIAQRIMTLETSVRAEGDLSREAQRCREKKENEPCSHQSTQPSMVNTMM